MIKILKQFVVYMAAVMIVIATGGFGVFHHHCDCTDTCESSILIETTDCDHEEDSHHCDMEQETEPACCSSEKENHNHSSSKQHHDAKNCCVTDMVFFKTDNFDKSKVKNSFKFIVAFVNVLSASYDNSFLTEAIDNNRFDQLPPPKYGVELLYHIQQLKISCLLS